MANPEDDLSDRVGAAVAAELPGEMVTRWLLIAEVIDTNGERALRTMAPDDAKAWDSLGLIEYAAAVERGAITADVIGRS